MNAWTRQLFEQLSNVGNLKGLGAKAAIQDQPPHGNALNGGAAGGAPGQVGDPGGGQFTHVDSEAWKRDVLELLFMAPGILPSQLPKVESVGNFASEVVSREATTPEGGHSPPQATPQQCTSPKNDGCCDMPMRDQEYNCVEHNEQTPIGDDALVRYVPGLPTQSAAEAVTHSSASLLRALRELKRVDEILEGCSAFWANMDGTVQKLAQMKEHTERLVNFAANSKPLRDRFEQRLGEYTNFWSSLERLCRQYCLDHQASAKRMYEVIREVSDAADVIDTAQSARLGMLSMMRDKQRRHGY